MASTATGALTLAYGGYYFSPWQSLWLDALRETLPPNDEHRVIGLAALIQAASYCAASPGHTAQPFKANDTAGRFLLEAWNRDIARRVREASERIATRHAVYLGEVYCEDAGSVALKLKSTDLVFIDPPYSGVHYSRFYHVLESVARGRIGDVFGSGRYPQPDERPASAYSVKTRSRAALTDLFGKISSRGATAVVTFPADKASNGLSGDDVKSVAAEFFEIKHEKISTRFSTLGGSL